MFAAKSVVSTIFVLAATFIALFVMFQVLGERAVFTAIPSIVITASVVSGVSFITKGSAAYLLMVCGIPFGLLFSNIYLIHMLATMKITCYLWSGPDSCFDRGYIFRLRLSDV